MTGISSSKVHVIDPRILSDIQNIRAQAEAEPAFHPHRGRILAPHHRDHCFATILLSILGLLGEGFIRRTQLSRGIECFAYLVASLDIKL